MNRSQVPSAAVRGLHAGRARWRNDEYLFAYDSELGSQEGSPEKGTNTMSAAPTRRWAHGDAEWTVNKRKIKGEYQVVHRVAGEVVGTLGFPTRREALAAARAAHLEASQAPLFTVDDNGQFVVNEEVAP